MRQTVRVADKPPWSSGATSGEKHCLDADNKLLLAGYCSTCHSVSLRDLDSLSPNSTSSLSEADT